MGRFPQTLDVADELHLDHGLPLRTHDHLAAEPLILNRLIAEQTGQNVVAEDLGHRGNDRTDALGWGETRLGQCAGWCLRVRLRLRVDVVRSGAETLGALAGVRPADPAPIRGGPSGAFRGAVGAAQGPLYFT